MVNDANTRLAKGRALNGQPVTSNYLTFCDMGKYYFLSYWGFSQKDFSNATSVEFVGRWIENYIAVCENDRQGSLAI